MPDCFNCAHLDYDINGNDGDKNDELHCVKWEKSPSKLKESRLSYGYVNHKLAHIDRPCDLYEGAPWY